MPLDPVTRRELRRIQRATALTLGLVGNPLGTVLGWFTEPGPPRPKRRVNVSADGKVTHTETLPPVQRRG